MSEQVSDDLKKALSQISGLTAGLLDEGMDAAQVAWALTTIATDMSLQICPEPLRVVPVLLNAITSVAENHIAVQKEPVVSSEAEDKIEGAPAGLLLH
jgi:hypothetical protein